MFKSFSWAITKKLIKIICEAFMQKIEHKFDSKPNSLFLPLMWLFPLVNFASLMIENVFLFIKINQKKLVDSTFLLSQMF